MDPMSNLNRQRTAAPSSSRSSFITRTILRRDTSAEDASSNDNKGPFGLTTLNEPSEPVVADLIFVHGLGGGSRSTWSKSLEPSLFWPQAWLPQDAGFADVRIHSFGYNSGLEKESILNIYDFAKSLLASIQHCPAIPRGSVVRASALLSQIFHTKACK